MMSSRRLATTLSHLSPRSAALRPRLLSSVKPFDQVLVDEHEHSVTVTLNRPKALNALNLSMIHFLTPLYRKWEEQRKMVVMIGAGETAFCAGGDIVQIYESGIKRERYTYEFFKDEYVLNHLIGTLTVPHVALLNGITMGGGVGLSVHGKFRVATEKTVFAMPETGIGFFCDVGGSYFLPRLAGETGMYLALTGARLKGYDVFTKGIATHFVPSEKIPALQKDLHNLSPAEFVRVGDVISYYSEHHAHEDEQAYVMQAAIDECFSADTVEEIVDRLRALNSDFGNKCISLLSKMSPTSLKVVFEQMRRGRQLSFSECFQMELRMSQRFMASAPKGDFFEGVRELLVDKTKNPKWSPARLEDVSASAVAEYFAPLPAADELTFH
eukprot:CAMPEP_0177629890 /NCGR_PEP_ID=MMETSP0447-20121125/911_1 /TAXON_ID=0 /ORGANISM="Stygamoeba regulata, Strain BSH-02190019" /LENGTH=383 /DNA_ID=CAMNT_0019131245 /DNA_START=64 /DNA_END=1215 /DNA_ORIENTATION=+